MVLSNKKLKQKLREAKSESIASSISGEAVSNANGKTGTILELQERLDAAKQKTRLVKKDKRKTLRGPETEERGSISVKTERNANNFKENEERKKRKREDAQGAVKEEKKAKMQMKKERKNNKVTNKKSEANANGGVENVEVDVGSGKEPVSGNVESSVNQDASTKVYVGGIPYYSTEDDIQSFFDSCGTITEVDCMKFPDSGKFRGIAIISFKTDAAAKRALDLDGADMGGFFLKVKPYKTGQQNKVADFVPQVVKGYNRIYIGNLSWDITEENIRSFFADCKISSIRFGMDKETGEFRGYGHVDFSDDVSMMMALKMDQQTVCGRPIKISCAVPKKAADANSKAAGLGTSDNTSKSEVNSTHVPLPTSNGARYEEIPTTSTRETLENLAPSNNTTVPVSGKVKGRNCYECGQKGHISTTCPNKQNAYVTNPEAAGLRSEVNSTPVPVSTSNGARYEEIPTTFTLKAVRNEASWNDTIAPVSGKVKGRTCYECGQRGHISTACPNKQNAVVGNPKAAGLGIAADVASKPAVDSTPVPVRISNGARYEEITTTSTLEAVKNEASCNDATVPSSGKIKRRTCYECGQKGHISTACPNKQNADATNPNTD